MTVNFSLRGYTYGLIQGTDNPLGTMPITPFKFTECLSEDPFVFDYLGIKNAPGGID